MKTTMKEIRSKANEMIQFSKVSGLESLIPMYEEMLRVVEELHKFGTCTEFSNDILREANGYKINYGDEDFSINQTFDLHSITATKAAAKRFGYECFGIEW